MSSDEVAADIALARAASRREFDDLQAALEALCTRLNRVAPHASRATAAMLVGELVAAFVVACDNDDRVLAGVQSTVKRIRDRWGTDKGTVREVAGEGE